MANRYENQCVSCDTCIGRHCPKRSVEIIVCDDCGDDIEGDIYEVEGDDLCESCLKARYVVMS